VKRLATAASIAVAVLFSRAAKLETLHEGRRAHVYDDRDGSPIRHGIRTDGQPCKGHPTVGIGCNLDRGTARASLSAVGADYDAVRSGDADLTETQIDRIFNVDLELAIIEASRSVPEFTDLPEVVQLVLVDMVFNMGSIGFPRMLEAVRAHDWHRMIVEMLDSKWAREDVPTRAKHDVEMLRAQLGIAEHAQDLDDEERANVLALVAVVTDESLRDTLAPHSEA
jgi:hypothetical protein